MRKNTDIFYLFFSSRVGLERIRKKKLFCNVYSSLHADEKEDEFI